MFGDNYDFIETQMTTRNNFLLQNQEIKKEARNLPGISPGISSKVPPGFFMN